MLSVSFFIVMLSVVMPSDVMLSIVAPTLATPRSLKLFLEKKI
jgi:hypothetical protein